jgi:hypothetical protein
MKYEYVWRNKWLTGEAKSIGDMIDRLEKAVAELQAMRDAGIILAAPDDGTSDDYARLVTSDKAIADKFGLEEVDQEE